MLGDNGRIERSAGKYLPYIGHIGPQAVLLDSGALMAVAHVEGQPFELADHAARNARQRLLNTLYRNIADDNVAIYTHLVRHANMTPEMSKHYRSGFAAALDAAYRKTVLAGRLYRNDYFITLIVWPRNALGAGVGNKWSKWSRKFPTVAEGLARELEDQWFVLANGLEGFGLRRLGVYERDGIMFSEIAEALRLIITGRHLRVPVEIGRAHV